MILYAKKVGLKGIMMERNKGERKRVHFQSETNSKPEIQRLR
jgi:hypothetical protein